MTSLCVLVGTRAHASPRTYTHLTKFPPCERYFLTIFFLSTVWPEGWNINSHGRGNNSCLCIALLGFQDTSENYNLLPHRHRVGLGKHGALRWLSPMELKPVGESKSHVDSLYMSHVDSVFLANYTSNAAQLMFYRWQVLDVWRDAKYHGEDKKDLKWVQGKSSKGTVTILSKQVRSQGVHD